LLQAREDPEAEAKAAQAKKNKIALIGGLSLGVVIIIAVVVGIFTNAYHEEKLQYVFELVRHGARAPMLPGDHGFAVSKGMLSATGMR